MLIHYLFSRVTKEEGEELETITASHKTVPVDAMTAYGEVKVQLHTFLTLELEGVCGQLYTPAALPLARELQVPCEEGGIGGRGGGTTGLDASRKRYLLHLPQIEPRNIQLPPRCLVTIPSEQRWVPTETSSEVKQSSGTAEPS